jgi:serine/threonine-protein kinase
MSRTLTEIGARTGRGALGAEAEPETVVVRPGDVLLGKYRVERVLGEGGMGVVVAAHHQGLDQHVAIKLLQPEVVGDRVAIARFVREARAAAKLQNEHVVRVIDVGVLDGGAPYMVMEHLDGMDLGALLKRRGALPIAEAVDYVLQALDALVDAHALGIVHRDLKPSNLFLARMPSGAPVVKVLDFGIAKSESSENGPPSRSALTTTDTIMGTPGYMAPEQVFSSKHVDRRADLFSLGVVLHELLTASRPFVGADTGDVLRAVLEDQPRPLRELRPDAPAELADVIARCLRRSPAERPPDAQTLARELGPFASPRVRALAARYDARTNEAPDSSPAPPQPVRRASPREASTVRLGVGEASRDPASLASLGDATTLPTIPRRSRRARWAAVGIIAAVGALGVAALATRGATSGAAAPGTPATAAADPAPANVANAWAEPAAAVVPALPAVPADDPPAATAPRALAPAPRTAPPAASAGDAPAPRAAASARKPAGSPRSSAVDLLGERE